MSEHNIPTGWKQTKISDISIKGLQRKPATDESFTYVDIGSIDRSLKKISVPQVISGDNAPSRARKVIENGDVLVSLTRPNLNAVALVDEEYHKQIASTGFEVIKPVLVDSRYIFALVRSKAFVDQISGVVQGALYPAAKSSDVQNFEFPLPPLAEQKVIVDKLDTLLAQVENTKARLERIPQILKRFRQSVLAAAVSGRLMDGGGVNGESWPLTTLAQLCTTAFDGPFGSKLKSSDYTDSGVGVVRLENIKHLSFDRSKETFISEEKYLTLTKNKLEKDDLLFSSFVDEEIRACLFPFETFRFINKADCFCLRIDRDKALPEFVLYLLTSQFSYAQIKEHVQGVTRPRVNLRLLKSLEFSIPPTQEQTEIVRRVDHLLAHADRIEQRVNNSLVRVSNLTQSILAKAFRGELTEQWRRDNPALISGENSAAALLERIKAEKAAIKPAKRTRKSKVDA